MSEERAHWSLDKRVPLALILTIAIQTGSAVWWASSLSNQVDSQGERITAIEATRSGERLAVLESKIADVKLQLDRIETKLDRIANK